MGTDGVRLNTYEVLLDKHKGQRAFVCGAGPSLYDANCSFWWREIFNDVVISVNSSIMTMPWQGQKLLGCNVDPDRCYWISNDALCRRWDWWELVKHSNCTKVVRDSWLKYEDELDGFLYFSPRPTSEGVINPADKGLAYCSSVPSAIDLAIQMGCTLIILLGVDNGFRNGYSHFWQLWDKKDHPAASRPAQGPLEQQERVFKINEGAYEAIRRFARTKGVRIVNCSLLTQLHEFAYIEFHAFMSRLRKGEELWPGVL